jgi:GH24 family phage-related lysozyme (muramidase)
MYQTVRDAFFDFNVRFEGYVPWMYLDVKGLVTIGVGNLIEPLTQEVLNLPFEYADQPGSQATTDDIREAWNAVKSRTDLKLQGGGAFQSLTNVRLTTEGIKSLVEKKLLENESFLRSRYFANFDSWPADAQLGLLSMTWALGAGFVNKWPKLHSACLNEDWDTVAAECHINDVGNSGIKPRNDADETLFSNAAWVQELGESFGYQRDVLY